MKVANKETSFRCNSKTGIKTYLQILKKQKLLNGSQKSAKN